MQANADPRTPAEPSAPPNADPRTPAEPIMPLKAAPRTPAEPSVPPREEHYLQQGQVPYGMAAEGQQGSEDSLDGTADDCCDRVCIRNIDSSVSTEQFENCMAQYCCMMPNHIYFVRKPGHPMCSAFLQQHV